MIFPYPQAIDKIHPKLPISGEQIMTTLLKVIWSYFLDIWTLRNSHLHKTAAQLDLPNYHQVVETLYNKNTNYLQLHRLLFINS